MANTERTVRVRFDGSANGLSRAARQAERDLEKFRAKADTADKKISRLFTTSTKGILGIGSAVSVTQGVVGLTSALVSMSGTLLVLPGAAFVAGAALGTAALATKGFGEALTAADPAEFAEKTKDMAPAMRDTLSALRAFTPEAKELRKTVQGNFWAGMPEVANDLGKTYLPILHRGLGGIATELGTMATYSGRALMAPESVTAVNRILGGTEQVLGKNSKAAGDFLAGLLQLGGIGAQRIGNLEGGLDRVAAKFRRWVEEGERTGRINEIIDRGSESAAQFGRVFGNLGGIGSAVWRGLSSGNFDFLGGLEKSTAELEKFLDSAEGQEILRELGDTLRVTGDVAREVFMTAIREAGPVIREIAPFVREFARALGDFLVGAMQTAGPILQDIAGFMSDNKEEISALIPFVLTAVAAYKGFKVITEIKGWVTGALGALKLLGGADVGALGKSGGISWGKGFVGGLGLIGAGVGATILLDQIIPKDAGQSYGVGFARNMLGEMSATFQGQGNIFQNWDVARWISSPLAMGTEMFTRWMNDLLGIASTDIVVDFDANTGPGREQVSSFIQQANASSGTVNINGRNEPAGQALAEIIQRVNNGNGTVTVNGQTMPADQALNSVIGQINRGVGTVTVNGQTMPAGAALADMLNRVNRSNANISVGADTGNAQGVINGFITRNDGRQIRIFTSVLGSGGIASAGRLATGGPVRGPGSGTSDTAGLFALSNGEHVWTDREVRAAGGHARVEALRRAVMSRSVPGLATGGAVGARSFAVPSSVDPVAATGPAQGSSGDVQVRVFIGTTELTDVVRTEVERTNRNTRRLVGSGAGRGF